jgi:hypothetical protein
MKQREEKIEWDKKKIALFFIALMFLLGAGIIFKNMIFQDQETSSSPTSIARSVKGAQTQSLPLPDIKKNIQNQIDNLKTEAQNINIVDVATSSPQVQKVINDLKAIQDYPKNQLRQTCEKICNGL